MRSAGKGIDWGKLFSALAERFGYTPDQIAELTLDAALCLLMDGKDPSVRTIAIRPGDDIARAMRRMKD